MSMNFVEFLEQHYGQKPQLADRYGEWLGYHIVDADPEQGEITTALTIRDDHLSPSGAVHGGVISGFLDFSCGCAAIASLAPGELCSTVELNVKYFKPLKSGQRILARAELLHRGKSLCSVMAKIHRGDINSEPIALATGTFNIYRPKF